LEGGVRMKLLDLTGDFQESGVPAVLVGLERGGQPPGETVIVQPGGGFPTPLGEFLVRVDDVETVMYTGLQVAKDPGVPVVWAGCILITIGTLMAFFTSHRRVWARVTPEPGGAKVLFAGNASRNRVSFEQRFEELCGLAKETFEK